MEAETSKTTTCTGFVLTGVGPGPIIRGPWHRACPTELIARAWRRMRLCWSATIRSSELPRLQDLLADARGSVTGAIRFSEIGWRVVPARASPCRRSAAGLPAMSARLRICRWPADSEIEFASSEAGAPADSPREIYLMDDGSVSLRELAEEELLLALPLVALLQHAGDLRSGAEQPRRSRQRPFAVLQDLLKKT